MDYNELYHYGVKGMKWGVRRDIGRRAKIAANLETRIQGHDALAVRAINKQQKLQGKRFERYHKGDKSAADMSKKEQKLYEKFQKHNIESAKLNEYRNIAIKDLSESDIKQGRQYFMTMLAAGWFIAGPIGQGIFVANDEYRTSKYIKNLEKATGGH